MNNNSLKKHVVEARIRMKDSVGVGIGKIKIYTLSDSNDIFYVGVTTQTLFYRLLGHINQYKNNNSNLKSEKINKMIRLGVTPHIDLIECFDLEDNFLAYDFEKYWIWQLKSWGFDLVNIIT